MPRVSVIVAAFNASSTIEETLRSVLEQTYDDWEIVVSDDASSDTTADLAQAVSSRITIVRAAVNRGPAAVRNTAIGHAAGELLAFLDADDRWLPEYLESQIRAFDREQLRSSDVGVVACDAYLEKEGRRLPGTYRDHVPFPSHVTLDTLLEGNPIFVSALAPSRVVRLVGGFDPRTFGSEDHDLWLKIVEAGFRVVDNAVPLAVYRLVDSSVSSRREGMARTNQATYRLALERGRLSPEQQRIARRHLRLHEAVEAVESFVASADRGRSPRAVLRLARELLTFAVFALTHPRRWGRWLSAVCRRRAAWRTTLR
jgi:glycosyltransferase involved in cell wall biosynthesis